MVDSVGIGRVLLVKGLFPVGGYIALDHLRSWLVSEVQAASCLVEVRMPIAEAGRARRTQRTLLADVTGDRGDLLVVALAKG